MNSILKSVFAGALTAVTSLNANALPEILSTSVQYRNFLVVPDGRLLVVGDCSRPAVCGNPELDGRSDIYNFVETGVTDAKYIATGGYTTAYISKDGKLFTTKITTASTDSPWRTHNLPGQVIDVAITGVDTYAIAKLDKEQLLYKIDHYGSVTKVSEKTDWVQLAGAHYVGGALDASGDVYMWGSKPLLLGNNATAGTTAVPTEPSVSGLNIKKLTIGQYAVTALAYDNTVWTWGENGYYRRLGDGTTENRGYPVRINGINKVKDAVQWFGGSYLILEDDTLASTGWDNLMSYMGQTEAKLPNTDVTVYYTDSAKTDLFKSKYISQGSGQSFFTIGLDGKVYGAGGNRFGELNIGTNDPVEVHYLKHIEGLQVSNVIADDAADVSACDDNDGDNGHGNSGGFDCSNPSDAKKSAAGNVASFHANERSDGRGWSRSKSR